MKNLILKAFLGLLFAALALTAEAQTKTLKDYRKLQASVEYPARIKQNKAFTLFSAKRNLREAKKNARQAEKARRDAEKVAEMRARIEELRASRNQ
jgi:hypothetical protein